MDPLHASRPTGIRAPARAPDAHLLSMNLLRTDSGGVQHGFPDVREIVVNLYDRPAGTLTVRRSSEFEELGSWFIRRTHNDKHPLEPIRTLGPGRPALPAWNRLRPAPSGKV